MRRDADLTDGFPNKLLDSLPESERRRVRDAVGEEVRSEEKHKKRRQRAAGAVSDAAAAGRFATRFQVSDGPADFYERLVTPSGMLAIDLDLVRSLWAHLPLELHRTAAARTLYSTSSIVELAERLGISETDLKMQLAQIRRILRSIADPAGRGRKNRARELLARGLGVRETARQLGVNPSTVSRWRKRG